MSLSSEFDVIAKNRVYRLVRPGAFEVFDAGKDVPEGFAVVRPTYLSICAADQRYWSGRRDPAALKAKLPLALIHEAVGTVVLDQSGTYPSGTSVVMVPNIPDPNDPDHESKENYSLSSKFASSSADGFMRDFVIMPAERLVPFTKIAPETAAMSELVSVCLNALDAFDAVRRIGRNSTIGIWGDGAVGFFIAATLHERYPDMELLVFGTHDEKLAKFDFVPRKYNIRSGFARPFPPVDHAFECVGGTGASQAALAQIIDCIRPQGVVNLMGVSEQPVPINTRMVLEKGLTLQGNSRSAKTDFVRAVRLLSDSAFAQRAKRVIARVIPVSNLRDMNAAFAFDESHPFKTIMKWNVPLE